MSTWPGAASWSGKKTSRKLKGACQIPEDQVGEGAVMNRGVVVGVEVTGIQEGGSEIVHIVASGKLIGSKVTGFPPIEICAATIVIISRGENALERSLLLRAEGATDLAI